MKAALVHEYFTALGGSEGVALVLHELLPEAPLYTLLSDKTHLDDGGVLNGKDVRTSFLQRLPGAAKRYWMYYPLFPRAVESLDFRGYDLVISSSHGWVKNIITDPECLHVCYCYTPLRYAWEGTESGLPLARLTQPLRKAFMGYVRRWDRGASGRADVYVAISREVQARIERYYRRASEVVYPPIDTEFFLPQESDGDYFLVVSRLVSYKRVDLAVQACTQLGLPLKVVGTGREMRTLARIAGPTVEILGWQPDDVVRDLYAGCRALILPGKEDLGLTAVEAQSTGRPVIAYGDGGALETVLPGRTGVHFDSQTVEALVEAIQEFQGMSWDKEAIRRNALAYDRSEFLSQMERVVQRALSERGGGSWSAAVVAHGEGR